MARIESPPSQTQAVLDTRYIKKGGDTTTGDYTFTGHVGVQGTNTGYDLYVNGNIKSEAKYILGGDMSFIPIASSQSAITTYWSLLLVGNHQGAVDYTPTAIGNNFDANVIIPVQQAANMGLIIYGATSQSGDLQQWRDINANVLAQVKSDGSFTTQGKLTTQNRFILGADLSAIPVSGSQSYISAWWGIVLSGNQQSAVDYTPSTLGSKDDASVLIPNRQASKIGLIIYGATSQSGNLQEWRDVNAVQLNAINSTGKTVIYNKITTAGWGVPAINGYGRSTAQNAAVASVAAYTVGATDGSFIISANVLVTTATAHSFSVQVTYTDESNTSRTVTFNVQQLGGTLVTAITNLTGAGPYEGVPLHIRAKASTAITILTSGTFTTVTYNVEGAITQIA